MAIGMMKSDAIEAMRNDPDALASIAIPDVHELPFPPILISFWWALVESVTGGAKFPKLAIGIPRGHAKSTMIKLFVLFCILFTRKQFILVISATGELAENIIADVCDMLDSENIRTLFGDWRQAQEKDRADLKKFNFLGRDIILAGLGAQSSFRGLNIKHARPDVMIFEDAQTKTCAESVAEATKFISWFTSTALKAKSPKGCSYIYVGNMYKELVIEYNDDKSPKVRGCMLHNLHLMDEWKSYVSGAILADGSVLWPELHSLETLLGELSSDMELGKEDEWFAEVQNDPTFKMHLKFDASKLSVVDDDIFETIGQPYAGYIVVDQSLGKKKSDNQAVGAFFVVDDVPIFYELEVKKEPQPLLVKSIISFAMRTGISAIFVEDNGPQGALTQWFEHWLQELQIAGIEIYGTNKGKLSKTASCLEFLKLIQTEKPQMYITKKVFPLLAKEAENFDATKTNNVDDILDVGFYGARIWGDLELRDLCILPINLNPTYDEEASGMIIPEGRYLC